MIGKSILDAATRMKQKNWDKIYVLVDIHNTVFFPCYHDKESFRWFDGALNALQYMTNCKQICLILWTSSHKDKIDMYLDFFEKNGIHFDYVNENPEVENDDLGCYDQKPYFNIGIDDKFGFDGMNGEWLEVHKALKQYFK